VKYSFPQHPLGEFDSVAQESIYNFDLSHRQMCRTNLGTAGGESPLITRLRVASIILACLSLQPSYYAGRSTKPSVKLRAAITQNSRTCACTMHTTLEVSPFYWWDNWGTEWNTGSAQPMFCVRKSKRLTPPMPQTTFLGDLIAWYFSQQWTFKTQSIKKHMKHVPYSQLPLCSVVEFL
jgi:hypothetical protein